MVFNKKNPRGITIKSDIFLNTLSTSNAYRMGVALIVRAGNIDGLSRLQTDKIRRGKGDIVRVTAG